MPLFDSPAWLAAGSAFAVRLAAGWQGLSQNPLLSHRQLDSEYYVQWGREIWAGDVASAKGIVAGTPFILNPLYAYVIAPIAGVFAEPSLPILVFQALMAAATTAMSAVAARRFFGLTAAWVAGIAVAFSAALVQLDTHVAVSGLAAFLTAGAVFASALSPEGSSGRGHGPVAAGLWLGLGALARPITPLALPFFAWKQWKDGGLRRVAVLVAVFAACSLPSLARNWAVTGEPVLYTSASGLNMHLGNNPDARRFGAMTSENVRFDPMNMHDDAYRFVVSREGGDPSPSQVSSYFTKMTVDEFIRAPWESAAYYANKARWFFTPTEVPSTSSFEGDLRFTPLLHLAFVPTCLVAAFAAVGVFLFRRRREVLCGPAAIVLAHWAVLTLVFPLSHYRSPAIPAMAVLAGGVAASAVTAWREGAKRRTAAIAGAALVILGIGACPPQPEPLRHSASLLLCFDAIQHRQLDLAEQYANQAIAEYRDQWPGEPDFVAGVIRLAEISALRHDWNEAIRRIAPAIEQQPKNGPIRLERSWWAREAGNLQLAESDARAFIARWPGMPDGYERLGEALRQQFREAEAAEAFRIAAEIRSRMRKSLRQR